MRRIFLPLFWKFSLAIILVVMVFGGINLYLIWKYTKRGIESETANNLNFYAHAIAREAARQVNDSPSKENLRDLMAEMMRADSLIAYIVVAPPENQAVVENRNSELPDNFMQMNRPQNDASTIKSLRLAEFNNKLILDIAAPVPQTENGIVRVGMFRERIQKQMALILKPYVIMVIVFLIIGIIGALFFSFVITRRVNFISRIAEEFTFQNLKEGKIPKIKKMKWVPQRLQLFEVDDELETLSTQINTMIDRLKTAYMELEQTYARFVQTEKMASIGFLSAGLAHEINNPIAGIQNCVRRIKNHPDETEKNREYIQLIEEAVKKTQSVVGRLLDYSRSPRSVKQAVNPATAIEKALLLISYRLEKSRISVLKTIPHNISAISGNQNEVEQIFVNLFLNGIDAIEEHHQVNPECEKKIFIDVTQHATRVRISIADTGIGMTPAQKAKIYDPFYTTKDTGKGTGLGMYVVYNLVQSNNGIIQCSTQRFGGTTFTLEFFAHERSMHG